MDLLRDDGKPGIFFSAHLGNWEIVSLGASQRGIPLDRIYRAANNRLVEWLYRHGRKAVEGALIAKGPAGIRPLLKSLGDGKHLGMMVDQKLNDGIEAPFFGHRVMTAPALAELAFKFDCPVVPARVQRIEGAHFRLIVEPPLEFARTGDHTVDVAAAMARVNDVIERWVRDTPEQWPVAAQPLARLTARGRACGNHRKGAVLIPKVAQARLEHRHGHLHRPEKISSPSGRPPMGSWTTGGRFNDNFPYLFCLWDDNVRPLSLRQIEWDIPEVFLIWKRW